MIDTSYDSERQAGLSSANLVRVGLSSLVHSFRLSAEHLTCLPRFLPPSTVPCSTVLARLLCREMWPNHASFLLFTIPYRFSCCPARTFIPLCTNSFVLRSFHEIPYMRLQHLLCRSLLIIFVSRDTSSAIADWKTKPSAAIPR